MRIAIVVFGSGTLINGVDDDINNPSLKNNGGAGVGAISIVFEPEGRQVTVSPGTTILQATSEAGVRIRSECGGRGVCGKCRVIIEDQRGLNELTENETALLTHEELRSGYRLACRSTISRYSGKLTVVIPKESMIGERKFQATGVERPVQLAPSIVKYFISLPRPTLNDVRPDLERVLELLKNKYGLEFLDVDYEVLKALPYILREANWDVTVVIWKEREIISIEAGNTTEDALGLAIDLGTSKIVTHLVDLLTGETVAIASVENPQTVYGEDIISRIAFTRNSNEKLMLLQRSAVKGINETIDEVCTETGRSPEDIYEAVVAGNTAMHHLFLGIRPEYLALSPFTPAISRSVSVKADELNIDMNPRGIVNVLPVIAGFVGADAVADLLASGIHDMEGTSLLVDIGTNTEVFVSSDKETLCCSCASGPAFEGAHITQGMKAVTGAIEKVSIEEGSYEVDYDTIGDEKPIGLCGSGIVDVVAEMLRCGIMAPSGRFNLDIKTPRLRKIDDDMKFIVAWADETGIGRDIAISERDINEIQLAKAAVFTGCSILMKRKNMDKDDLDRVLIAGAFGTHIDTESAKLMGLIPDVQSEKIKFIGNAAVAGAKMALISKGVREEARLVSERVRYLELTVDPDFSKEFTNSLYLPHRHMERFPNVKRALERETDK
jgi:uncharacterized 2Fe-2S/4Fe-4S cluster protein (DUF4445 family)